MGLRELFGGRASIEPVEEAASSMMGVAAPSEMIPVEVPERAVHPFEAPDELIGAVCTEEYARFNEKGQVPWPGVYTIADDGVSADRYLEFDRDNAVFRYARVRDAG